MSRGLQWFVGLIATIFILIGILLFLVRSNDGPIEILSGGPFKTGDLVQNVDDWSFIGDLATIELQTMLPPRSRTMWLVVHDNHMFVLSNYMNTPVGRAWKQWPKKIAEDNRAIVRAHGKLYELRLNRILDLEKVSPVLDKFNEKYRTNYTEDIVTSEATWVFELTQR